MKLGNQSLNDLINNHGGALKATIYIPTDPQKSTQDSTRLKNALQVIRNDPAYDDRELGESMKQVYTDLVDNAEFWSYQDYGLAVFFDRDGYEFFHIPFEISEAEYLTDHFVISPLVITASADTGFYVLDVNFTAPRLYSGARGSLVEVAVHPCQKTSSRPLTDLRTKIIAWATKTMPSALTKSATCRWSQTQLIKR